jgi:hypothetical protein
VACGGPPVCSVRAYNTYKHSDTGNVTAEGEANDVVPTGGVFKMGMWFRGTALVTMT